MRILQRLALKVCDMGVNMANFKQFLGIDDRQYFTELNWDLGFG